MNEMDLYKLCCTDDNEYGTCMVDELGWVDDNEFYVWVPYLYLDEFVKILRRVYGYGLFDDGDFNACIQSDGICINLCSLLGDYEDLEEVFPKDKYPH